ncbi:hypothetical protein TNCV_4801001 [Trichonephila clavipes]|nr:hypothetical protein TNCV_4801001 [Trichonephila clavipes]
MDNRADSICNVDQLEEFIGVFMQHVRSSAFKSILLGLNTNKFFIQAFADDLAVVTTDHFAKVATANGVDVSVTALRSYVIKTLQNKLRTGRVGGQTLILAYELFLWFLLETLTIMCLQVL